MISSVELFIQSLLSQLQVDASSKDKDSNQFRVACAWRDCAHNQVWATTSLSHHAVPPYSRIGLCSRYASFQAIKLRA